MWSSLSCARYRRDPESLYKHANQAFLIGELKQSQDEAERAYNLFRDSNASWAWRFRILQARSALWRGLYDEVLHALEPAPTVADGLDLAIPRLALVGVARVYLHDFSKAERALSDAESLCAHSTSDDCGDVLQARGFLASEQKQSVAAEKYYELTLSFATSHNDAFLKSTSLLNLGAESLSQGRFDEAVDRSEAAHRAATAIKARAVDLVAVGNLGWAYYELGNAEKAFNLLVDAEELATELHDVSNLENQLTNIGYVYMDQGKLQLAAQSFRRALALAEGIKAKEQIYNAQRVLARLALRQGDLDAATDYSERALSIARASGNHVDEIYPRLIQGQVAARRGDPAQAEQVFKEVEQDSVCPVFLKWESQHSLARLYEDEKQLDASDGKYRAALATFESARSTVRSEDFQLSFLTNAARIYDDYVHFLVAQGKSNDALRWADYSRARTLSEGLGLLSKGAGKADRAAPPPLKQEEIARHAKGLLLFYWLGEKQSYLWAVTPQKTSLFTSASRRRHRRDGPALSRGPEGSARRSSVQRGWTRSLPHPHRTRKVAAGE